MNINSLMRNSRGIIVMADVDPTVQPISVAIPRIVGTPAFTRDVSAMRTQLAGFGLTAREQRRDFLVGLFAAAWRDRNGALQAADQQTTDELVLFGNLLIDEIPLGHLLLVQDGSKSVASEVMIAARRKFLKWVKSPKLFAAIDCLRTATQGRDLFPFLIPAELRPTVH